MDPTLQATQTGSLSKPFRAPRGGIAVALLARVLLFSTVMVTGALVPVPPPAYEATL